MFIFFLEFEFTVLNLASSKELSRNHYLRSDETTPLVWLAVSIFAAQFCLFFIFSLKRVVGAEHCTDTAADPRPRVCQLAVCTSCGRVTKRWAEISLRLHLVLDSEKEVDLPTEPRTVIGWLSVQPTHTLRRDQPAHTYSCSTRVTHPAAFRCTRGLTYTDQSLNPLPTYQTPLPTRVLQPLS